MSERKDFIDLYLRGDHSVAELCRRFCISRKTAYKWLRRFFDGCELVDRSRRPHTSPHAVAVWLLDVAFVYATIGFLPTVRTLASVEKALREQGAAAAANLLSLWQGETVDSEDANDVARLAAEQALREAHYGTFGPLFWFLVLPGPVGLVL